MCVSVALAIWLEQKYQWASKVSGAIIALILAMFMANVGIIPVKSVLYDDIVWGFVVPMGIPLLLLQCNIKKIWKDAGRMLTIFLIGAVGTVVGAFLAYFLLRGPFGDAQGLAKVAAILTASATVADNLLMACYFFVLIAFAGMRFFRSRYKHPHIDEVESGTANRDAAQTQAAAFWSRKDISLKDIAMNFAYAIVVVWAANLIAGLFSPMAASAEAAEGAASILLNFVGRFFGSQYVWITTISVIVATFFTGSVEKMHGSQEIGTYLIYRRARQYLYRCHRGAVAAGADFHDGGHQHALLLYWRKAAAL